MLVKLKPADLAIKFGEPARLDWYVGNDSGSRLQYPALRWPDGRRQHIADQSYARQTLPASSIWT